MSDVRSARISSATAFLSAKSNVGNPSATKIISQLGARLAVWFSHFACLHLCIYYSEDVAGASGWTLFLATMVAFLVGGWFEVNPLVATLTSDSDLDVGHPKMAVHREPYYMSG